MQSLDSESLREVASAFSTGITIVCTRDSDNQLLGMTANSFLSVSLDPPLVLFSVMNENNILQAMQAGKQVCISILSESQKSISDHFAGQNQKNEILFDDSVQGDIIKGSLAWYTTSVERIIEAGDHNLILCRVLDLGKNEGFPLVFYQGYKSLGTSI